MAQNRVTCICKKCNQPICSYINEWIQINNVYSTYEYPMSYTQTGLVSAINDVEGTEGSELEGLIVVSMACKVCGSSIGIKCIGAPAGKPDYMYVDIYLFRVSWKVFRLSHHSVKETSQKIKNMNWL